MPKPPPPSAPMPTPIPTTTICRAQAIYWVGDIAYVQQDYPGATRAFAEQIKKYPKSASAVPTVC